MDKRTKEITLPSGETAVVKTYLNARDAQEIELASQGSFEMSVNMKNPARPDPTIKPVTLGDFERKRRETLINEVVVALGKTEAGSPNEMNINERALEGSPSDYRELIRECEKIARPDPDEPKQSNDGETTSAEDEQS